MSETTSPSGSGGEAGRGGWHNGGGRGRGRVRHRGGRGGRGGGSGSSESNFKGNTEGMNGHVFQCFNESTEKKQFARTLEVLGEYAAKNMDYAGDLNPLFKSLEKPTLTPPEELSDEDAKSKLKYTIWEKQVAT
ncbi:hypothetical protein ACA910_015920 [Epithemia clementina (nom. ined.)]